MNNQRIVLVSRPVTEPSTANFRLEEVPLAALADGQVRVKNHYLSLDPYMRGRMSDAKNYAVPQALNETMIGGTVGEVVESKNPKIAVGALVVGMGGWQQYSTATGNGDIRVVDTKQVPLSAYLGTVGMPGMTAWYGLMKLCEPKAGETVCVDAASGAVGSVVGQLAKLHGCRAVGIAGGAEKCAYVVNDFGFDACIDYKAHRDVASFDAALKLAAPAGIDCHFENVGGMIMDGVLNNMNAFGRVAMCGMISGYSGEPIPLTNPSVILRSRLKVQGFIVSEHMQFWPDGLAVLGGLVGSGKLKFRESIADGLASAPQAFLDLLIGKNFGKQLVTLA